MPPNRQSGQTSKKHVAVIGAGMAGIACARTLAQAGWQVSVFEKSRGFGGRMSTRRSQFGDFDHGTQYFTVRDPRFEAALATTADVIKRWSANTVRVMDASGHVLASTGRPNDAHWVPVPGMSSLLKTWGTPLQNGTLPDCNVHLHTRVTELKRDGAHWTITCEKVANGDAKKFQHLLSGFDHVVVAIPHGQANDLLEASDLMPDWQSQISDVLVDPCWTLMLAYPNASQPGLSHLGPHWNVARSTHHRISWVARESSKPGRSSVERWTIQASPQWSQEHVNDAPDRVKAKLAKAFGEITGIRAEASHAEVHRWVYAQTRRALGQSYLLNRAAGLGVCGDWCLGNRVENAFISGLELALAIVED